MPPPIKIETVQAQPLAAVVQRVPIGRVGAHFKPSLDKVYAFLTANPDLKKPGAHNVFLYRNETGQSDGRIGVEFCVQVARAFQVEGEDEVFCSFTPPGRIVTATHIGPYETLGQTHNAIRQWAKVHHHTLADASWEIYGDWSDDRALLETKLCYLLK